MHCYQCEQTPEGGCTTSGVCGKDPSLNALQDLLVFGLKGVAAYASHARDLGYRNTDIDDTIQDVLYTTLTNVNFDPDRHLSLALDVGDAAVDAMSLLDEAHTSELGVPEPTTVPQNELEGHPVLVTGHDLAALKGLLEQTADEDDVTVYTHSEMLPAHGYPELAKYDHLKGNIGGAWHDQRALFEEFPGAILGTSNCVQPPTDEYRDRFFTSGIAALQDAPAVDDGDFTPVIETAKDSSPVRWEREDEITTGFHHRTLLGMLDDVVEAVEDGKIRHFFVVAGCDGPTPGRNYYREFVKSIPDDCIVMTTSCGKFRFNDLDFGTVPGTEIPRYVDFGQCNNSISAALVAAELADALDCTVGDLPLSVVLSWFEQKAVAVLLGLLSLGVEDIRLGPTVPEFVTPELATQLEELFGLRPITDVEQDLEHMLGQANSPIAAD